MAWPVEKRREAVARYRELKAVQLARTEPGPTNWEIGEDIGVPYMTLYRWDREQRMYEDAGVPRPSKKKPGRKPKTTKTNKGEGDGGE